MNPYTSSMGGYTPMMGQPMMGQPMMGQPMMGQPMMPPMMGPMMPPVGGIRGMPGCPKCYGTGMKRSKFGVMKPCKRCMKMMAVCM